MSKFLDVLGTSKDGGLECGVKGRVSERRSVPPAVPVRGWRDSPLPLVPEPQVWGGAPERAFLPRSRAPSSELELPSVLMQEGFHGRGASGALGKLPLAREPGVSPPA